MVSRAITDAGVTSKRARAKIPQVMIRSWSSATSAATAILNSIRSDT